MTPAQIGLDVVAQFPHEPDVNTWFDVTATSSEGGGAGALLHGFFLLHAVSQLLQM